MIESAWSDVHNVLRETASTFDQDAIRLEGDELIQMLHTAEFTRRRGSCAVRAIRSAPRCI
ncbi:hypothetical protein PO124_03265 [Bacillus licheniformis]|nr:hypothetical protein [Bacillus licheniformis]